MDEKEQTDPAHGNSGWNRGACKRMKSKFAGCLAYAGMAGIIGVVVFSFMGDIVNATALLIVTLFVFAASFIIELEHNRHRKENIHDEYPED